MRDGPMGALDNPDTLVKGKYTLNQVERYWRDGFITEETYRAYLHTWQTSAFRNFNHCRCVECNGKDWS